MHFPCKPLAGPVNEGPEKSVLATPLTFCWPERFACADEYVHVQRSPHSGSVTDDSGLRARGPSHSSRVRT